MTSAPRVVDVCSFQDLPVGGVRRVNSDPPVAVFNDEGVLRAIDDTCSHQDASLSDGWFEDGCVECPLHGSRFDLRTGAPEDLPAEDPVRVHRVLVDDGVIRVELAGSNSNWESIGRPA
jgi:3-phenylpropionate/trans-cinnamate dioxygenase ferredoxin component